MATFKEGLRSSGQSVLDARAQNLYEMVQIEESTYIQECKKKLLLLQGELNKHKDLAVTSRDSLNPGGSNFNAKEWIYKRHDLAQRIRIAQIEYALALKVDAEEFPKEDEIEGMDLTNVLAEDNA